MSGTVTQKQIAELRSQFSGDATAKILQNAVTTTTIQEVALNRDVVASTDFSFSTKLDDWKATSQKASGRCWLFAFLNLFRKGAIEKMNVKDFEFSQAHLHFWDKFERANANLEAVIATAERDIDDRALGVLLAHPSEDGGQWNMAVNIVLKHGVVPQSVYPESQSSSSTYRMNANLRHLVRAIAAEIRGIMEAGGSEGQAREHKQKRMADVWKLLNIHLGTPPRHFDWQWRDKDDEFHRRGRMTPK